ncbi:MAG: ATP phosphoribosyltransferase regulatory subunit [Helicobacteraceae bacterium]|jgi:histidyl-tRNA synthetase|nr:ATP phosphoribosyltransferase regulatory subunit [Helicobacteraceae bacterium]
MIFEHEIPEGSKLYFGDSAKRKREIEQVASEVLYKEGFEEIVTPLFSYHQDDSIADVKELVRINDTKNNKMSLRADSTIDVVRIITKRLGRNTTHSKWFYIQPIYRYPSTEQYQVGAEVIGESDLSVALNQAMEIFGRLEVKPLLQISNIAIPMKLSKLLNIGLDDFRHINIQKFLELDIEWVTKLVYLQHPEDIDAVIEIVPDEIKEELFKMKEICQKIAYKNKVIAPLYYAEMLYYDELFFRVIEGNKIHTRGGRYVNEDVTSVGFAIYTDTLIEANK